MSTNKINGIINPSKMSGVSNAYISKINGQTFLQAFENFVTGYTETDPDGFLTIDSPTKISWSGADFNSNSDHIQRNADPNLDADFDIAIEAYISSVGTGSDSLLPAIVFTESSSGGLFAVQIGKEATSGEVHAFLYRSSDSGMDYGAAALNTNQLYYLRIKRDDDGGTGTGVLTCDIYTSESDRSLESNAVENLSLNLESQLDIDVLRIASFDNFEDSGTHTGYFQNLDLSYSP
jgi:hypothetical protein